MSDQKVTGNFPTLEQLALSNSARVGVSHAFPFSFAYFIGNPPPP
jgi:hypothetical protein